MKNNKQAPMTRSDYLRAVERVKKHIHDENVDYCGATFAIKQVMGNDYKPHSWQLKRVAFKLTVTGKYYKEISVDKKYFDIDIIPYPKNTLRMKKWQMYAFWPTFIIAVFGGLYTIYNGFYESPKQQSKIEVLEAKVNNLQKEINQVKQLIEKQDTPKNK
ncbi:hypothetical protein [Mangrovimonas spongiae]|uniref:Uncharacterized protein n=1 Tax=Mangrovimonas spongiae TaxID=2494697 RepID=A0A3R9N8R3_9FLAO|nr:hypothetical protein [Mangrovimonas spongiae]RSK41606.1 hypothetical protein EJA19_01655 [Mangrovimonas spongiae]